MKWLWISLAALLAVAAGATWFAFSDPTFWTGLITAIVANLMPIILKRNSPVIEDKMEQASREGLDWDNFNKRPRDPR